jgi:hypothetical protein
MVAGQLSIFSLSFLMEKFMHAGNSLLCLGIFFNMISKRFMNLKLRSVSVQDVMPAGPVLSDLSAEDASQ